jgi:hypothetical protein
MPSVRRADKSWRRRRGGIRVIVVAPACGTLNRRAKYGRSRAIVCRHVRYRASHWLQRRLAVSLSRQGVGFGELTLTAKGGRLVADTETMGDEFCLDVVRQALRERE